MRHTNGPDSPCLVVGYPEADTHSLLNFSLSIRLKVNNANCCWPSFAPNFIASDDKKKSLWFLCREWLMIRVILYANNGPFEQRISADYTAVFSIVRNYFRTHRWNSRKNKKRIFLSYKKYFAFFGRVDFIFSLYFHTFNRFRLLNITDVFSFFFFLWITITMIIGDHNATRLHNFLFVYLCFFVVLLV